MNEPQKNRAKTPINRPFLRFAPPFAAFRRLAEGVARVSAKRRIGVSGYRGKANRNYVRLGAGICGYVRIWGKLGKAVKAPSSQGPSPREAPNPKLRRCENAA